jgi:hypothetical protein
MVSYLECEHKELELIFFSEDPPAVDAISVKAMGVLLDDIAPGIDLDSREFVPGYVELKDDILMNGMNYAIIVVPNSKDVLKNGLAHLPEEYHTEYDPHKPWLCIFGNQRLSIALDEGFRAIDVYPMKNIDKAIILGKRLESGEV